MTGGTDTGLALALLSTTAYNSGLIVEKQALARLPALNGRRVLALAVTLLTAPRWLAGFALMLCGLGLQVLALMFAPVTVVQPVIASGVAVVLVLSRIVLRERLGRVEYACVARDGRVRDPAGALRGRRGRGRLQPSAGPGWPRSRSRPAWSRWPPRPARRGAARASTRGRPPACPTASPPACCTAWPRWPSRRCPGRSGTPTARAR